MIYIIGGGVSSLICAITMARLNKKVTILEKNDTTLKKLLLTGSGKCNYYNSNQDINKYHTSSNVSLTNFINEERLNNVLNFYSSIGVIPFIKNGYYYPYSKEAVGVKAALLNEAKALGIDIILNCDVQNIKIDNENYIIETTLGDFSAQKVIIATGGKSYPKTGSDGGMYKILERLGYHIIKPRPALVGLKGSGNFKDWEKIRTIAKISLYEDNILIKEEEGELQLTNYGISGICVLNLSSIITRGIINHKKEIIKINFMSEIKDDIYSFLDKRNKTLEKRTISELFDGILNYKLVYYLLKKSKINSKTSWDKMSFKEKNILCENLKNFEFTVTDTNDFLSAQVTSGGVDLEEITNNFESKKYKNLYFIGEVLDVDGACGGYNLTFAALSAIIVGEIC